MSFDDVHREAMHDYYNERPHPEDLDQPSRSELAEDERDTRTLTSDTELDRIIEWYRER